MRTGQKRKMTPSILAELLKLRKKGWSFPKLGEHFGLDHSTVIYHWQKHIGKGSRVKTRFTKWDDREFDIIPAKKIIGTELLPPETINYGKTYIDYLKIQGKRENTNWRNYLKYHSIETRKKIR